MHEVARSLEADEASYSRNNCGLQREQCRYPVLQQAQSFRQMIIRRDSPQQCSGGLRRAIAMNPSKWFHAVRTSSKKLDTRPERSAAFAESWPEAAIRL